MNIINDTSQINPIEITQLIKVSKEQHLHELRAALQTAREHQLKISVIGAKHTQGGHIAFHRGIVLDLSNLDTIYLIASNIVRVQSGATWKQVVSFLHPLGLSVDIMQSDHDFSIGGTVSANAHGWQANKPPIVNSIHGFHILTANGEKLYCTRQDNADLFKTAIGGYGLVGILIDVDFVVVQNTLYTLSQTNISTNNFLLLFRSSVKHNKNAQMFLGHFTITRTCFLKRMLFLVYEDSKKPSPHYLLSESSIFKKLKWWLFKKTYRNDFYQKLRSKIEQIFMDGAFQPLSRNKLLYRTVHDYLNKHPEFTDLLQEYFIPIERFNAFVTFLQSLEADLSDYLLNITVRHVQQDVETILNFASKEMLAFVMYFRGEKKKAFDSHLKALSKKITEKALRLGGSYYLPYRPYQTVEQFKQAYPKHQEFLQIKLRHDPEEIFCNQFYSNYFLRFNDTI